MAPPNYFLPKITAGDLVTQDRLNPDVLRPRGLQGVWADVTSVQADCTAVDLAGAGPGGAGGCILCVHRTDGQKPPGVGQYKPDRQHWVEVADGAAPYWLGLDQHLPPGPEDLVRKGSNPFDRGYSVELGDGAEWFVPVIRDVEGGSGLPQDWALEADGTLATTIQATYVALWREFAAVVDLVFDPGSREGTHVLLEPAEAMRRCLQGLQLRYRLTRPLLNALRLINSRTWFGVVGAMLDLTSFWDVWLAAQDEQKKSDAPGPDPGPGPESPPTGPGGPDCDPTTDRAGPSSSWSLTVGEEGG